MKTKPIKPPRQYTRVVRYGEECEHCDGHYSEVFRIDELRGRVCHVCDDALDEMEESDATPRTAGRGSG